jgi:cytochrome o ubiquinol oxidase operon protein cyoD
MENIGRGSFKSYFTGFILSLILTLAAYFLTVNQVFVGVVLMGVIGALTVIQALVQLFLFLDLGRETKPRWNLIVFLFMLLITLILVVGSIWIMYNLNYNLMG